jgi:hypothetical protein
VSFLVGIAKRIALPFVATLATEAEDRPIATCATTAAIDTSTADLLLATACSVVIATLFGASIVD